MNNSRCCPDSGRVSSLYYRSIRHLTFTSSPPGESPPPAPRLLSGRDELIEKIVKLAQNLTPIALIGAGGIGKTSIALAVLHDERIKQRFGENRRLIRCDQFPASRAHFLRRLSNVVGAGIKNPEDLSSLRAFLSLKEMFIVLDNAESILDPQGVDAQEIYYVVEELSRFYNICVCITSRIFIIPPDFECLEIPTLSKGAAYDTFYRIYGGDDRSNLVNGILEQLDFHPLSITLLATVARNNQWGTDRLAKEWERRRIGVLQTKYNNSLAATIELSLASPMFQELGPDARELLGVVAFFPQGVDENNLNWLFPAISDGSNFFDKFCNLSLTYQNNGFVTMLAPLRDYLCPKDPISSPLLTMAKEQYFTRLSVNLDPNNPDFGETRWIISEDVNVEHLLDVFTSIDADSKDVWDVCANFMVHLYWNKPRLVLLGPKIEALPDNHPSKARCLQMLSWLFDSMGNQAERKRLLIYALNLWRKQGNDRLVALILGLLSDANRQLDLYNEGIQQVKEALEIFQRFGDTVGQVECLINLAWLMHDDGQLDAAEETASRAINLLPEEGERFLACRGHRVLGDIYRSEGKSDKAVQHLEVVLKIASSFNWYNELLRAHLSLAEVFSDLGRFDDAHAHIERAKEHAVNDAYNLARAMKVQANLWYIQGRLEEARSEALRAADVFEKLGAARDLEGCRKLLRWIEEEMNGPVASGE